MDITISFDVGQLTDAIERLEPTLERSMRQALVFGASRVTQRARQTHGYTDRTGTLTRSIHEGKLSGSWSGGNLTVTIIADAPYAAAIEYGSRPHEILPRRGKYLRFQAGGRTVYAKKVHHPGTKAYEFLFKALEATHVGDLFDNAIENSLRAVGL